jgi:NAD(P)H-hydrate epimerase
VIEDRLAALREAADRFGHAVLLKGAPSLVTGVGRPILVDTQATSDLAVAGMGDALAGVCTSLMAQGVSDVDAGALGLFFSGRAARIAGRGVSLTPSDVVRWLPAAMNECGASDSDLALGGLLFDAEAAR